MDSSMKVRRMMKGVDEVKNSVLAVCVMMMVCLYASVNVKADQIKEERHLIQTTNYQDEYEGLLYLDMLRVHPLIEPDIDNICERIAPAIVRITMGNYTGSGIVIGLSADKVIILSNRHLLENAGDGMVSFSQGFEVPGTASKYSNQYDMALMEVQIKDIPYEQLSELRYVTMKNVTYDSMFRLDGTENNGELMTGDPVVLVGSADKAAGSCEMGVIRNPSAFQLDFYTEMLEVESTAVPGMSGGIVCDGYGRMIGMITGNSLEDESRIFCMPIEKIILLEEGME